ncbi:hypothetical protein BDR06DRAFT_1017787 [Suillus hirtellus]|nr:hypothetical protein BDR06DRAFT_1017787 [Suillus hirtellus]
MHSSRIPHAIPFSPLSTALPTSRHTIYTTSRQLSVLLSILNRHSPEYNLYQYQCYWYTHTVWEALKRLFPDCFETKESAARSSYLGFPIDEADSGRDMQTV